MALNTRGMMDPRWAAKNQTVLHGFEQAQIEVYKPNTGSQTYDPITNTYSGANTPIWVGPARIQGMQNHGNDAVPYNPGIFQSVKMQISHGRNKATDSNGKIPEIRTNYIVRVTSAPYDESLLQYMFVITSVINSSNAWERTFQCRVETELDPTYDG